MARLSTGLNLQAYLLLSVGSSKISTDLRPELNMCRAGPAVRTEN